METYRPLPESVQQSGLAISSTAHRDLQNIYPPWQQNTERAVIAHENGPSSGETVPTFPVAQEQPPYTGLVGRYTLYRPPE